MNDLLVLGALWCFAVFCFGFGWIMGHASAMGRQADEILSNENYGRHSQVKRLAGTSQTWQWPDDFKP